MVGTGGVERQGQQLLVELGQDLCGLAGLIPTSLRRSDLFGKASGNAHRDFPVDQ